jgi:hypothetical protein
MMSLLEKVILELGFVLLKTNILLKIWVMDQVLLLELKSQQSYNQAP